MLNSIGKATFSVIGRIYNASLTNTSNPCLRVKILRDKDNYVTVLIYGELISQFNKMISLNNISANSENNPWISVDGKIFERKYKKNGFMISDIALIATSVVIPQNEGISDVDVLDKILEKDII